MADAGTGDAVWAADPWGRFELRWFDGSQWTDRVARNGEPLMDPPGYAAPPGAVPEWYPDPTGRFGHRYFDGRNWTEHVANGADTTTDPPLAPPPTAVTGVDPDATPPRGVARVEAGGAAETSPVHQPAETGAGVPDAAGETPMAGGAATEWSADAATPESSAGDADGAPTGFGAPPVEAAGAAAGAPATAGAAAAQWAPDPFGRFEHRWFDGTVWTDQVARGGDVGNDPASPNAPVDPAPAWQPDPFGRHQQRWFDGTRWTEHVADGGDTSTDDPVAAPPA